jgi:hypothetical protein
VIIDIGLCRKLSMKNNGMFSSLRYSITHNSVAWCHTGPKQPSLMYIQSSEKRRSSLEESIYMLRAKHAVYIYIYLNHPF